MNDIYNRRNSYRYIDRFHVEYPEKLQNIKNPPAGIYVKGRLPDPDRPAVAMVGSRNCSEYGRKMAAEFAEVLSENGVQIISGMARGIDGISQRTAAEKGHDTYGILGCGIEIIYPKENHELYDKVLERGGLISEFEPQAPPLARQFPARNRIISALADIVLVVEAGERSGTGITVQRALEQGKDIYAIPGRVHDICSAGCNRLISQGAGIAYSPEMVLLALGIIGEEKEGKNIKKIIPLEKNEKVVYAILDFYPKNLEEIRETSKLSIPQLVEVLFHLQMKGIAAELGKNNYVKLE